jgi:GTPase
LKIGSPGRFAHCARARAIASLGCAAVLATLTAQEVALAASATLQANPRQVFGVHPVQQGRTTLPGGHFNFALAPGESITDAIVIENLSDSALTFHVYGADLLTAAGGGLAPAQPTAPMREAGAWITIFAPTVTIRAHGQLTDKFTLRLPVVVSVGEHLGAVVVAADVGLTPQGIPIEARTALITVVTVPGVALPSGRLDSLAGAVDASGHIAFDISLFNTGNVLLTYAGAVTVVDSDGHRVAMLALTPTTAYVVPGGRVQLAAVWTATAHHSDQYSARATVTILADGTPVATLSSQTLALSFTSALLVIIAGGVAGAVVLIVLFAIGAARRRRQRRTTARGVLSRRLGSVR